MKTILFIFTVLFTGFGAQADDLESRVDTLEMNSFLEAVRFNSIFNVRTDMIDRNLKATDTSSDLTSHRMYYALDGTANLSNKLNFFSRLSITKTFNSISREGFDNDLTAGLSRSRAEGENGVHLERAYFNYSFLNQALVFSAGRLPTVDGPPLEMYDNLPRQGTYPAYSYGSVLDGFALTYGRETGVHRYGLRGIYTPLTAMRYDATSFAVVRPTRDATGNSEELSAETPITTAMLEYEWSPNDSKLGSLLFIGQSVSFTELQFSDQVPRGTNLGAVFADPSTGVGNGIPSEITGADFTGSTLNVDYSSLLLMIQANNIASSGVNLGITSVTTSYTSRGFLESNTALLSVNSAVSAFGVGQGFMTEEEEESKTGSAMIIALSYQVPSTMLNDPTVGLEYLSSDENYQFWDIASHDITNFKATRGTASHLWWSQPLDNGFLWRLGYVVQNHKYSKGFLGAPTEQELDETTLYSNFRLDF